ncbi:MAG: IclR family transcriptional regulator [Dehalococcoidales bacterium]|nr:IclR family transcriptional regulator [Dehalococcoidales bacterium]
MTVIQKTFKILELFLDHGDELALEDMARLSGLSKPTVRRIARSLVECGYLRQPVRRGKYSLGWKFLDFSGRVKMYNSIIRLAAPHLMMLKEKVNESVCMAIWDGTNTALCQSFLADHPLRVVPDEGSRLSLHATSLGKAILAELPEHELNFYLGGKLERYTPNTITDINDLKRHLILVRQEGVAFDEEEYYYGVRSVATTLKNGKGEIVGAIAILGPTVRLSRARLYECVPIIKNSALEISAELGYSRQNQPARQKRSRKERR